jgi:Raf kinase inhibitor-like YbhB/YbcL family protein
MFDYDPYAQLAGLKPVPSFTLTSADIHNGVTLPLPHRGQQAGGNDLSPQLSWSAFPSNTKSFAVTTYDPDAPTGSGFWHWAVFNIPPSVMALPAGAGAPSSLGLPAGAVTLPNDMRLKQYSGATPPEGTRKHRYIFVVHAVDVRELDIDSEATPAVLGINLHFHTVARAHIVATAEYNDGATFSGLTPH